MKLSSTTANIQFPANPGWSARCLVIGLSLSLWVIVLSSVVRAELVDHIVAAVNNDVITASDLAHAVALNQRFSRAPEDRQTLESGTLEGLITRRLLVQEARRLRFVEVSDEEITDEYDKLRKLFGSDKAFDDFLAAQDMTGKELRRMLGERLLVERFVEKKVAIFVRVNRDEVQSYYENHADEYKDKRFQDVQKTIVALLTDQKIEKQLKQYIAELRRKADIRINAH